MKDPILIIGIPRSRTSMTAGIINLCGAWGGDMRGPNKNNKKGMFENRAIVNGIIKPTLIKWGCDRRGQYPLPDDRFISKIPYKFSYKIRSQVIEAVRKQGLKEDQIWFYKGLKMTFMWSIFHAAFPSSKWIIVRRKDEHIIESCMKTGFMNAFLNPSTQEAVGAATQEEGWQWWIDRHKEKFDEIVRAGLEVRTVWTEQIINGDYKKMKEIVDWCGLKWSDKVYDFVDPTLGRVK